MAFRSTRMRRAIRRCAQRSKNSEAALSASKSRLLDAEARRRNAHDPLFVVGSSGLQYAMTQWWNESGLPSQDPSRFNAFAAVDRVLAVSGSASKLTAMQIDAAVAAGFAELPLNARRIVDDSTWPAEHDEIVAQAADQLAQGRSVLLHTARGPDDARIDEMIDGLALQGMSRARAKHEGGRTLGIRLGENRAVDPRPRVAAAGAAVGRRHVEPGHAGAGARCAYGRGTARAGRAVVPDALERRQSERYRSSAEGRPDGRRRFF
jgi:hypothetical protein